MMTGKNDLKTLVILFLPFLLFAVLVVPYSFINSEFLVERFGCGCPNVDENGNMIEKDINANTITAGFWLVVALISTVIGAFLSVKLPKIWMRIIYVIAVFSVSLIFAHDLTKVMMWN